MNATDSETVGAGAGSWLTVPDLAERLGLTLAKARRLVSDRYVLGTRRDGVLVVPAEFLVPGHLANPAAPGDPASAPAWVVLASLPGTITVLTDVGFSDDEALDWLFAPDDQLGTTPVAALRAGHKSAVRRLAQSLL
ncbi:MAG: Rv2175c family DNA-binding protein [Micrococcales bacterium]|nr:Rv2175c family DNA-binding protein [Micrococcales bacterium]